MSSDITIPSVLYLPEGMAGLSAIRTLDAMPIAGGQFVELIARDEPALGWLAADAEAVRLGMTEALKAVGRIDPDDVLLVLLASHGEPAVVTANLAGPIAIAPDGTARQLILEDSQFELRARVGRLTPTPVETP